MGAERKADQAAVDAAIKCDDSAVQTLHGPENPMEIERYAFRTNNTSKLWVRCIPFLRGTATIPLLELGPSVPLPVVGLALFLVVACVCSCNPSVYPTSLSFTIDIIVSELCSCVTSSICSCPALPM